MCSKQQAQSAFNIIGILIFLFAGGLHLTRMLNGWTVNIGGWDLPMWVSGFFVVVLACMIGTAVYLLRKN